MKRLIVYMAGILLLAGCSTTKHLPEGEILYTGQKKDDCREPQYHSGRRDCHGRG